MKTVLQRFSPSFLQDSGFLILEQRLALSPSRLRSDRLAPEELLQAVQALP